MWRCPSCGEPIDDEFDACWNCGTLQDGTPNLDFQTEPSDLAVPDLGPDPELPTESAEDIEAARVMHERIVEVCSAANIVEADGLCELLEEAGIHARVVGDELGGAAGCLPLGEATAPRVWVRESDAIRAREVIDRWRDELERGAVEPPESEEPAEPESSAESETAPLASDVRFRFFSQVFFLIGLMCIVFGSIWAWGNSMKLSTYPATADGRAIKVSRYWREVPMPGGPGQPLGPQYVRMSRVAVRYAYVVDGRVYHAWVQDAEGDVSHTIIHYDPQKPAECIAGSIAPPWVVLLFAFGIAAFLSFVGHQFR